MINYLSAQGAGFLVQDSESLDLDSIRQDLPLSLDHLVFPPADRDHSHYPTGAAPVYCKFSNA